jgi:thiol-disulfide isomerase/thioredoxin
VSPALAQLAGELAGQVKLVKVNVDQAPKPQQRLGVQAIPTLMVLRNGQVVARQAGAALVSLPAWTGLPWSPDDGWLGKSGSCQDHPVSRRRVGDRRCRRPACSGRRQERIRRARGARVGPPARSSFLSRSR